MTIFNAQSLEELGEYAISSASLGLIERPVQPESEPFFNQLTRQPVRASGTVRQARADQDVERILRPVLATETLSDSFYAVWTADMANICRRVAAMLGADHVGFRLDTRRTCRRYHLDNISIRTVVTYHGAGTEYLLDDNADREAYDAGAENNAIVRNPSKVRTLGLWDVAAIRGGPNGLLHKTPDMALHAPSVFMRIDPPVDAEGPGRARSLYDGASVLA